MSRPIDWSSVTEVSPAMTYDCYLKHKLSKFDVVRTTHRDCTEQYYLHFSFVVLLLGVSAVTTSHHQAVQVAITDTSLSLVSLYQHLALETLTLRSLQTIVTSHVKIVSVSRPTCDGATQF